MTTTATPLAKTSGLPSYGSFPYTSGPPGRGRYSDRFFGHRSRRCGMVACCVLVLAGLIFISLRQSDDGGQILFDLSALMNSRGFGRVQKGGDLADFDGLGHYFAYTYPKTLLQVGALQFRTQMGAPCDNVVAQNQTIALTADNDDDKQQEEGTLLGALYLLVAVHHGTLLSAPVTVHYVDGTHGNTVLSVPDWQVGHLHQVRQLSLPWPVSTGAGGALFALPVHVDPRKAVRHVTLPSDPRLHVFGMTGYPASSARGGIKIVHARPTYYHGLKITLHNTHAETVGPFEVHLGKKHSSSALLSIHQQQQQQRRRHHHRVVVEAVPPGQLVSVTLPCDDGGAVTVYAGDRHSTFSDITFPSPEQCASITWLLLMLRDRDLDQHEAPAWLENAKFGIFVHWGVYAVPAWAPVGKEYSEWYWWQMNDPGDPTHAYHNSTYGPDFAYDDFIDAPGLGDALDPGDWLDLIDASGARYFVFTTKHHDGIALWNTSVTGRSLAQLGPRRDFVRELMDMAEAEYPHLRRGVYFSLPEWYHPHYDGRRLGWAGGPPRNPYTGAKIPYTGSAQARDFVNELQVPQALELIERFEPDVFWCDLGGSNNSSAWQLHYFQNRRPVAVNDRCGNGVSDFATVEYHRSLAVPDRFWEATRGIDPYSFGYNRATPPHQYASTRDLLLELVEVVSMGGNFLLNIGPDGSGSLPDVVSARLRDIGRWIRPRRHALFDTHMYWAAPTGYTTPQGVRVRFTAKPDGTLYLFLLDKPSAGDPVIVDVALPIVVVSSNSSSHAPPDKEERVNMSRLVSLPDGNVVDWTLDPQGRLVMNLSKTILALGEYIWVFELTNTPS
ncbi:glycoside hydrolase superfamily [Dichotomocladium elegans]|nr:glycoside hydrolase superfamily [Dichotomocladium elegans]